MRDPFVCDGPGLPDAGGPAGFGGNTGPSGQPVAGGVSGAIRQPERTQPVPGPGTVLRRTKHRHLKPIPRQHGLQQRNNRRPTSSRGNTRASRARAQARAWWSQRGEAAQPRRHLRTANRSAQRRRHGRWTGSPSTAATDLSAAPTTRKAAGSCGAAAQSTRRGRSSSCRRPLRGRRQRAHLVTRVGELIDVAIVKHADATTNGFCCEMEAGAQSAPR